MKFFILFLLLWDGETWRTMSGQEILERAREMCKIAWSPCDTQMGYIGNLYYPGTIHNGVLYTHDYQEYVTFNGVTYYVHGMDDAMEFYSGITTAPKFFGYWTGNSSGGDDGIPRVDKATPDDWVGDPWYNYYGNDCSGFVSICWGMPERFDCRRFINDANGPKPRYCYRISNVGELPLDRIKPGDAIVITRRANDGSIKDWHIMIVHEVNSIDRRIYTYEQTPPIATELNRLADDLIALNCQVIRRKDLSDDGGSEPPPNAPSVSISMDVIITQLGTYPATVKAVNIPEEPFLIQVGVYTGSGRLLWRNTYEGHNGFNYVNVNYPTCGVRQFLVLFYIKSYSGIIYLQRAIYVTYVPGGKQESINEIEEGEALQSKSSVEETGDLLSQLAVKLKGNVLYVEGVREAIPLSLYDVAGRKVISATITPSSPHLDVSQLRSGIYFVVFKGRGNTQVKKRIVKF